VPRKPSLQFWTWGEGVGEALLGPLSGTSEWNRVCPVGCHHFGDGGGAGVAHPSVNVTGMEDRCVHGVGGNGRQTFPF
jgi:hypothetical protein